MGWGCGLVLGKEGRRMMCCAVLCCAALCCAVVCGGGRVARVQCLAIWAGHTPWSTNGVPNEGPTWGCPTASRSYLRTGCW